MSTALALLHGGQHGSWCWQRLIDHLPSECPAWSQVLTLDVPGCGAKRGQLRAVPTLANVAAELHTELQAAGADAALLVGHSMAGTLMPEMAARAPGFYRRLVYLAACLPRRGESVMATMGGALRGLDPSTVGWPLDPQATPTLELIAAMFGPGLDAATLDHLLQQCPQDQWPLPLVHEPVALEGRALPVPATYIVTLRDAILPPAWQGRFAERAGARAMPVLDAGHEVFLTHPGVLASLLQTIANAD